VLIKIELAAPVVKTQSQMPFHPSKKPCRRTNRALFNLITSPARQQKVRAKLSEKR